MNIGEQLQEYTKYKHMQTQSDMVMGKAVPVPQKAVPGEMATIRLPENEGLPSIDLFQAVQRRRSRRDFLNKPLRMDELSVLLSSTQRVVESGPGFSLRPAPSAGARHPLETYLVVNNVESLEPGIYLYLPFNHELMLIEPGTDIGSKLRDACLNQNMLERSSVNFIWSAVIQRSRWKYQQRAYRYIYLDAGHNCQNLYLACESLGIGCCAIAAFDDDAVNQIISADGIEEFTIYLAAVGKV